MTDTPPPFHGYPPRVAVGVEGSTHQGSRYPWAQAAQAPTYRPEGPPRSLDVGIRTGDYAYPGDQDPQEGQAQGTTHQGPPTTDTPAPPGVDPHAWATGWTYPQRWLTGADTQPEQPSNVTVIITRRGSDDADSPSPVTVGAVDQDGQPLPIGQVITFVSDTLVKLVELATDPGQDDDDDDVADH